MLGRTSELFTIPHNVTAIGFQILVDRLVSDDTNANMITKPLSGVSCRAYKFGWRTTMPSIVLRGTRTD